MIGELTREDGRLDAAAVGVKNPAGRELRRAGEASLTSSNRNRSILLFPPLLTSSSWSGERKILFRLTKALISVKRNITVIIEIKIYIKEK